MKRVLIAITASALISLSSFASERTIKCQQRLDRSPVETSVGKISVVITHLRNIGEATDYRGEYFDSIDKVKVVVSAVRNSKKTILKSVVATATSADVMYMIDDSGISFRLYMDEVDESNIGFKLNDKKIRVSLVCK